MKRILSLLFLLCLLATKAWSAEEASVSLKLPPQFVEKLCATPVPGWKDQSVRWKGVTDGRKEAEVGLQSKKKGKDPISVTAQPPLEVVLNETLKQIFSACGLKISNDGKADLEMSAEIEEFHAGVEKGFLTGKGVARSKIQFHLSHKNSTSQRVVDLGYELDSKEIRQKDIKQLEKTLNDLLARTLEQIPVLDGLKNLSF